jgi:hypothetical protein
MLSRAAIKDRRPTKAAKQREPGRELSLCPFSRTMERMRTTRLKRAWKAREARMGEDVVVAIVDDAERLYDARERRLGEEARGQKGLERLRVRDVSTACRGLLFALLEAETTQC